MRQTLRLSLVVAALAGAAMSVPAAHAAGRCGTHPWCDTSLAPEQRAGLLLGAMTMQEKVDFLGGDEVTGVAGGAHTHTGTQDGIPRLGVPTVYYSDGPVGPRQGASTGLPAPIALAATFDPLLARLHGDIAANEAKLKGNDVIFGPTMNMMRIPMAGRTYEAYGEDPFLTARLAVGWIQGAQAQGVIADAKHFAANNQEGTDPTNLQGHPEQPLGFGVEGNRFFQDSVVDERTLREIYLPQFEAAVKEAHVGTVMCSYNKLNGQYACENDRLLHTVLRREWGFDGYVLADYGASHNTIASLNNGLDFEPWPPVGYQPLAISLALAAGQAGTDSLDEHVRAILTTWFRFGLFDRAAYRDDDAQIDKAAHARDSQRIAEQAITLLRNESGTLPLDASKLRSIAVIGQPATTFTTGGGSGNVTPFSFVSPLDAIRARAGRGVTVTYNDGSDAAAATAAAKAADVAIVVAGDRQSEGADRACLTLECPRIFGDQDGLIGQVAAANRRTIVVLATGGPDLTPWRNQVAALLEAWYPGGHGGTALARVLFGDVDPGGRLPVTFPDSPSQLPTAGSASQYPGGLDQRVHYSEGVLIGYRWYDARGLKPAYPFGYGLSYTTFSAGRMRVVPAARGFARARVSVTVKNTGRRTGTVVPQLYLSLPSPGPGVVQPPSQLRGFRKLELRKGRSKTVAFVLDERAFSYWDTAAHGWRVAPGCAGIMIGTSSRYLPLRATMALGGASCPGAVRAGRR